MPDAEHPPLSYPVSFPLAAAIEREVIRDTLPNSLTSVDGSPVDSRDLAPHALIAAGAMAVLRSIEPEHPGCSDPTQAVAALFTRKNFQRTIADALPNLTLPKPYYRLQTLREQGQSGTVSVKSLEPGEEITLEYSGANGRSGTKLVVARSMAGEKIDARRVIIRESYGKTIRTEPLIAGKLLGTKLCAGMIVWLGHSDASIFTSAFTKGTFPAWSSTVKKEKQNWIYTNVLTDTRTTLRQVYYGNGTALPLF